GPRECLTLRSHLRRGAAPRTWKGGSSGGPAGEGSTGRRIRIRGWDEAFRSRPTRCFFRRGSGERTFNNLEQLCCAKRARVRTRERTRRRAYDPINRHVVGSCSVLGACL